MSEKRRLEEQALSQATELQISQQLESAEQLDVDVRTNLIKMAKGQAKSVSLTGKELVTQQNLRVQEVEIHVGEVSIQPLSALLGNIQLNQPIDFQGRVILTEQDINLNINTDFLLSQLPLIELNVGGEQVQLEFQPPMEVQLPGDNKLIFRGEIELGDRVQKQQLSVTAALYLHPTHPILVESISLDDGQVISLEIIIALIKKIEALLKLPYLEFQGIKLWIKEIVVQQGSLAVQIEARTDQIPV